MNPSQNDSFGSFSSGQGGYIGQPAAYSTGPVMINNDGRKKSKKWVWILVLVVLVAVAGGIFALWQNGLFNKNQSNSIVDDANFHDLLVKHEESLLYLVSTTEYIYGGEATIDDLILSDTEYEEATKKLNDGVFSMTAIAERLKKGPELSGINAEIDLRENYGRLKSAMANDYEKYKMFVDLTVKLYQAFKNQGESLDKELFTEYNSDVLSFVSAVEDYFGSMQNLNKNFSEQNCSSINTGLCDEIESKITALKLAAGKEDSRITQMYISNIGNINSDGEGSIIYYLNNLYIATEEGYKNEE